MSSPSASSAVRLAAETWESLFRSQVAVMRRLQAGQAFKKLPIKEYDVLFTLSRCPTGKLRLPATFSSALQPGQKIEYYAEVVDEQGGVLEHLGTPALPFGVSVETLRGPSVARKWWFWTVTGVLVAGVAVGVGLGVHYSQAPPPQRVNIGDLSLSLLHW